MLTQPSGPVARHVRHSEPETPRVPRAVRQHQIRRDRDRVVIDERLSLRLIAMPSARQPSPSMSSTENPERAAMPAALSKLSTPTASSRHDGLPGSIRKGQMGSPVRNVRRTAGVAGRRPDR